MKIKITRPDGTIIEIEGTAQDVVAIAGSFGFYPPLQLFTPPVAGGFTGPAYEQTFKVGYGG